MIELETASPSSPAARTKPPGARKRNDLLNVVLPILIVGAGVFVIWRSMQAKEDPSPPPEATQRPAVNVVNAELVTDGFSLVESGSVVPYREVTLAAEVAGRIVEKADVCRAGRFVTKGTTLLTIDPRNYELEVLRLQQEVKQAEVGLEEANVELSNTRELIKLAEENRGLQDREVARLRSLVSGRAAAASELDQARSAAIMSTNTVQTLKNQINLIKTRQASLAASLQLAETRLERAKLDLERTAIRSPCDGVVISEMVEADSFVGSGVSLVTIEDTSAVEVRCNLRSDYLTWLWSAKNRIGWDEQQPHRSPYEIPRVPATVSLSSGDERYEWDGVLNRYEGLGLDQDTRTVPCRILVSDPTGGRVVGSPDQQAPAIVRGMFVEVSIHVVPDRQLLAIPSTALRLGDVVWVVREEQLVSVPVRVVLRQGDNVIVEAGDRLQPGEDVVTSPVASAVEGLQVQVEST